MWPLVRVRSVGQWVSQLVSQSVSRSVSQKVSRSVGRSVDQSVGQSPRKLVSQSVTQKISRSVDQSVSWSVTQKVSQSVLALSPSAIHDQILVIVMTGAVLFVMGRPPCHVTGHSPCLCQAIYTYISSELFVINFSVLHFIHRPVSPCTADYAYCLYTTQERKNSFDTWTVACLTATKFGPLFSCAELLLCQCYQHLHVHNCVRLLPGACTVLWQNPVTPHANRESLHDAVLVTTLINTRWADRWLVVGKDCRRGKVPNGRSRRGLDGPWHRCISPHGHLGYETVGGRPPFQLYFRHAMAEQAMPWSSTLRIYVLENCYILDRNSEKGHRQSREMWNAEFRIGRSFILHGNTAQYFRILHWTWP
jgi:hypothetical protein